MRQILNRAKTERERERETERERERQRQRQRQRQTDRQTDRTDRDREGELMSGMYAWVNTRVPSTAH